jgi:hypothetical protein
MFVSSYIDLYIPGHGNTVLLHVRTGASLNMHVLRPVVSFDKLETLPHWTHEFDFASLMLRLVTVF